MDTNTIVLLLAVVAIVLAAVELFRTQAQSLAAWAAAVLGVALIVAYWPS